MLALARSPQGAVADDVLAVASAHRATSVASIHQHDSLWARSVRPLPSLDGRGVARDLQHAVSVQAPSCGGQSRSVTQPNPRGKAGDARNGDGHPSALGPPTRPPKPAIELGRKRLRGRANPEIGPIKGRKVRARDRLVLGANPNDNRQEGSHKLVRAEDVAHGGHPLGGKVGIGAKRVIRQDKVRDVRVLCGPKRGLTKTSGQRHLLRI